MSKEVSKRRLLALLDRYIELVYRIHSDVTQLGFDAKAFKIYVEDRGTFSPDILQRLIARVNELGNRGLKIEGAITDTRELISLIIRKVFDKEFDILAPSKFRYEKIDD